jgi:chromate reductase, NAD(P)H dehydrogenase (quinone)
MNVLAISGSLRQASVNSAFCRAAARLAPATMKVSVSSELGALPLFNPDLEDAPPRAVRDLRDAVGRSDALILASPEYAHGISGVLKNALDWLVSYEGTVHKPVAVVNTSPRAHHAIDALREVLKTMSTVVVEDASISVPLLGGCTTEAAMLDDPRARQAIEASLRALAAFLASGSAPLKLWPA